MFSDVYFKRFCKDRNLKLTTIKGYCASLKIYCKINGLSIDKLLKEAYSEENSRISLKNRKIKLRLLDFRNYLFESNLSDSTSKAYFTKVKTFYRHFDVELPRLPQAKYHINNDVSYLDLPTKDDIHDALMISQIDMKAIILFMSSSGTARAETLSLTVGDFVDACVQYHNGGSIEDILNSLSNKHDIVPTFYLKRIKSDKFYYTFCSPEASDYIVKYLKTRKNLKVSGPLFDFSSSILLKKFQQINDDMGWGFKGHYRFFRSHALRKFHASNIGLSAEYIDSLQGRSKNVIHETYIKTNPDKLKDIYMSAMKNIMIFDNKKEVKKQEFNIIINVFLSGKEYNIFRGLNFFDINST